MNISKSFRTETAHIVRKAYSERCCKNVHGHSYLWIVHFKSDELDDSGMVIDFGNLKEIKDYIDLFDHAMVLWQNEDEEIKNFFWNNFERVIIMSKNVTAENFAQLILNKATSIMREKINDKILVSKVECWETTTGCAIADTFVSDDISVKFKHQVEL